MKKITIILIIILASFTKNFAQLYNEGAQMNVQNGTFLKVDGDFLNDINSNFVNNGTIIIKGNITNNQTMLNPNTGLWELIGSASQSISGIYPLNVFDIKFLNPAGIVLNNGLKISNQANFTNGLLTSSDANLIFFGPNATLPTAPTDASHVVGPVAKQGLTSFTFPVGDANKYEPIKADFTQNTDGFIAKYVVGNAGSGNFSTAGAENTALTAFNTNEYWDLQPLGEGNTTAQITLYWDNYNDFFTNDIAQRKVAHKVGTDWLNEGATTVMGNTTIGSVRSALISNWSPFTLGFVQPTALPLNLLSFSGKKVENGNMLNWKTSHEVNASHFEIERSADSKSFIKIGTTKANGGPAEKVGYEFLDQTNLANEKGAYYRLRMVDLDGKYNYSKIIYLENLAEKTIISEAYPNPAFDNFTKIDINTNQAGEWQVNQLDIAGKLIFSNNYQLNNGHNTLEISNLTKGMNIIQIRNNEEVFVRKVIR